MRNIITKEKQRTAIEESPIAAVGQKDISILAFIHTMESFFSIFIQGAVLLLEFTGACTLIYSAFISVYRIIRVQPHARLGMAQGIAMSLCFKLGAEVLRTTIIRNESELLVLAVIIVLHAAMSALIHWEIRVEEKRLPRSD